MGSRVKSSARDIMLMLKKIQTGELVTACICVPGIGEQLNLYTSSMVT